MSLSGAGGVSFDKVTETASTTVTQPHLACAVKQATYCTVWVCGFKTLHHALQATNCFYTQRLDHRFANQSSRRSCHERSYNRTFEKSSLCCMVYTVPLGYHNSRDITNTRLLQFVWGFEIQSISI